MKFCEACNNMLYVGVEKDATTEKKMLSYYCKTCGFKSLETSSKSILVLDDNKVNDRIKYSQYVNKYIKYDPCLPRVKHIECPNEKCSKSTDQDNEVIYIKYDGTNMKYVYYCCHCDHFWTNNAL